MSRPLTQLIAGQELVYGGDRVTVVPTELAEAFREGDRLVIVQETGDLLHIPSDEHRLVSKAVSDATAAFASLADCSDDQISEFFERFAARIDDASVFGAVI
ncbi:MAG TPA: glutamate-5-semialdehyde dehydrogenase, partial [Ilumatobacteraceae bacterium]|nr:glutamate-5-semialdehyde dehydrogenase [Ilumatobacteraceae bacterium]